MYNFISESVGSGPVVGVLSLTIGRGLASCMTCPDEEVTTSATHRYRPRRALVQGKVVELALARGCEEVAQGATVVVVQVIMLSSFRPPPAAPAPAPALLPAPAPPPAAPVSSSALHLTRRSSSLWTMAGPWPASEAFEDAIRQPTVLLLPLVVVATASAAAIGGGGGTGTGTCATAPVSLLPIVPVVRVGASRLYGGPGQGGGGGAMEEEGGGGGGGQWTLTSHIRTS